VGFTERRLLGAPERAVVGEIVRACLALPLLIEGGNLDDDTGAGGDAATP
jgi:hypothetical protein